jgi:predicted RNA binding protein YcfA (HicA-like mRNA interferase family)
LGFEFYRSGKGDHEIWFNPESKMKTTIPHHREVKEGTLHNILKQAQVDVEDFLMI